MAVCVAGAVLATACGAAVARADAPPPLSSDRTPVDIGSTFGSGVFGRWIVDAAGLPAYRYAIDQQRDPRARQSELGGATDAWHQLGNDHVVADAFNHGYTQLWSQDRLYQWTNLYDASTDHFSGGFGYLKIGGRVMSTLYDDRPPGTSVTRDWNTGSARTLTADPQATVDQHVYAPFGDDPILLHDVTIANPTARTLRAQWYEYWDVNPAVEQNGPRNRGLAPPAWDPTSRTLTVDQLPDLGDADPLTIYAAPVGAPVDGFETDARTFFGAGTRAAPAELKAGALSGSIAPPAPNGRPGQTLFVLRSPVDVPPGGTVTLRYAYGAAHRAAIAPLLDRYRRAADPLATTLGAWRAWLPQISLPAAPWLSRELQWDAYMVRSGETYEETCGHHILSQGGYYQYGLGLQGGFRDQLGLSLSMISLDPEITREVIRYSAQEQERASGHVPYAMAPMCIPVAAPSADLDAWFLLAASEYALTTRDLGFFDERVRYQDGGDGPLWDHVKLSFHHMEDVVRRGPHGGYLDSAGTGDWADFGAQFMQMTESMLITAQLAYVYPRLADVADLRGDAAFAAHLRATAALLHDVLTREYVPRGWFSRGYSGARQLGRTTIYEEPQPWALLAGAATPDQAGRLLANVTRFLRGVGAPGGPSPIGSAQSPAADDPGVGERASPLFQQAGILGSYGGGNAVFLGGVWYALNGPLAWAAGELADTVPGAGRFAWDEFLRNTLAWHANAFPAHWDSTISVDDVCWAWYSSDAARCGDQDLAPQYRYDGDILNLHAWWLFAVQRLAGIEPTAAGLRIDPHLPFALFSLRLPDAGLASEPRRLRGYLRPVAGGPLRVEVTLPPRASGVPTAWVDGRPVPATVQGRTATFTLPTSAGRATDWALTWG
jgi:hypothetical protein